eukprot:12669148-Alexandrium_andersonii.AAC.1
MPRPEQLRCQESGPGVRSPECLGLPTLMGRNNYFNARQTRVSKLARRPAKHSQTTPPRARNGRRSRPP